MKNMTSLMKVELILMKRQAAYYLLSIGLPSVFYLIFSGVMSSDTPTSVLRLYLFSMTVFSIMSSAFFSIPSSLQSDKTNNWQKMIQHSPVSMVEYYISKLFSALLTFLLSSRCFFCWAFCSWSQSSYNGLVNHRPNYPVRKFGFHRHGSTSEFASQRSAYVCCGEYCLYGFGSPRWSLVSFEHVPSLASLYR